MKCDELKSTTAQEIVRNEKDCDYMDELFGGVKMPHTQVYLKYDVDAAIAELKEKLRDHCTTCPVKEQEDDVVADLKRKLESVQASMYCDVVDANMENRKLKRALWLVRAKRAEARKNYWYVRSIHEGDENMWSIDGSAVKYIGCIKRTNFEWLKIWSEVEIKCKAKAEKYK